jgi:hypothetical protein
MPATKIQNEQEVIGWFRDGLSYEEMSRRYLEQYQITMTPSAWSNFRKRRGLDPRSVHDDALIPWTVREEHRYKFPLRMLRVEGRIRAGEEVSPIERAKRDRFIARLADEREVVAYLPEEYPEEGFVYVRRTASDDDIIRRPRRVRAGGRHVLA